MKRVYQLMTVLCLIIVSGCSDEGLSVIETDNIQQIKPLDGTMYSFDLKNGGEPIALKNFNIEEMKASGTTQTATSKSHGTTTVEGHFAIGESAIEFWAHEKDGHFSGKYYSNGPGDAFFKADVAHFVVEGNQVVLQLYVNVAMNIPEEFAVSFQKGAVIFTLLEDNDATPDRYFSNVLSIANLRSYGISPHWLLIDAFGLTPSVIDDIMIGLVPDASFVDVGEDDEIEIYKDNGH